MPQHQHPHDTQNKRSYSKQVAQSGDDRTGQTTKAKQRHTLRWPRRSAAAASRRPPPLPPPPSLLSPLLSSPPRLPGNTNAPQSSGRQRRDLNNNTLGPEARDGNKSKWVPAAGAAPVFASPAAGVAKDHHHEDQMSQLAQKSGERGRTDQQREPCRRPWFRASPRPWVRSWCLLSTPQQRQLSVLARATRQRQLTIDSRSEL